MALDMKALADAQEDLKKRGVSGTKNWIQLTKIEAPIEVRIQDPLPSMGGIYYVEVPVWWINGVRVISTKLFGPQERDTVEEVIEEAKRAKDGDILKLLNAKDPGTGISKIQKKIEFWIPVLKLNWDLNKQNKVQGIYDAQGNPDPKLIRKFIEDDRWKILVVSIQALKAINVIATMRGGDMMVERVKGFNIILAKTGKLRDTKYTASKDEVYPMPVELYTPEKMLDPFELAQSLIFTDEYMDAVIGKYLYNENLPERGEEHYAYPELREKFKAVLRDDVEVEEIPAQRLRPSRVSAAAKPTPEQLASVEVDPDPAPLARSRHIPQRGSVSAGPVGRRPQRDLAADLKAVE